MLTFKAFLFLITICIAKSEVDYEILCKNEYRDENNNQINVLKYCSHKLCIEKCCGPREMMFLDGTCWSTPKLFNITKTRFSNAEKVYKSINILSSLDKNKTLKNKVVFVQNDRNFHNCTSEQTDAKDYEISEDGSLEWLNSKTKKWNKMNKLKYCIDYKLFLEKRSETIKEPNIKIIIRQYSIDPQETGEIESLEIVVMSISSFFLMLVLVVYCLLPDLRNLSGLVLMAYTFSLLFAFVTKLIQTFIKRDPPDGFCQRFSPVVYFAFMSSIFWLSVISYDLWRGLRSCRIKRSSKRSELMKFMWYSLYAWGTPLLITAIVIILNNNIEYLDIEETPFDDCLVDGTSFDYYFKIPVGILICINIILFVMIVYHIWIVKRSVNRYQDSRSIKQQNNKFSTYAKLSVMMGLSWCLELLPDINMLWFYILTNLYNVLTGVAIFYLFVCKKKILVQLCKKFNIQNDFTKKLEAELLSQHTKNGITRSTGVASSVVKNMPKDQNQEIKSCPKEESIIV